jgi:V/A-type H+-transporting ATPase subunit E
MKKTLEKGEDKIRKLTELLKRDTLEPAEKEAQKIIEEAKKEAERIMAHARHEIHRLEEANRQHLQKERSVFESSLEQAARQSQESIRQAIEERLLNKELGSYVQSVSGDPKILAALINAMVGAIEKEGLSADFSAILPKAVQPRQIYDLLLDRVKQKLGQKEGMVVGDFEGGVRLKLHDRQMTIDLSNQVIEELLKSYIRKDFRRLFFTQG